MSDLFNKLKEGANSLSKNLPQGKAGVLGAAGVGALLGSLFGGSKGVQRTAKNVAVVGGSAALAALAYKMYQNWSSKGNSNSAPSDDPFAAYNQAHSANNNETMLLSNDSGKLILEAMIFAARADGHIDSQEQTLIMKTAEQLGGQSNDLIREYLNKPLNPYDLSAKVHSREQALDLYRLSAAAIISDNDQERRYLSDLANALSIDAFTQQQLDQDAAQLRQQMSSGY